MGAEETSPPERTVREGDGVLKVVLATVWAFLYQKKCVGAKSGPNRCHRQPQEGQNKEPAGGDGALGEPVGNVPGSGD